MRSFRYYRGNGFAFVAITTPVQNCFKRATPWHLAVLLENTIVHVNVIFFYCDTHIQLMKETSSQCVQSVHGELLTGVRHWYQGSREI